MEALVDCAKAAGNAKRSAETAPNQRCRVMLTPVTYAEFETTNCENGVRRLGRFSLLNGRPCQRWQDAPDYVVIQLCRNVRSVHRRGGHCKHLRQIVRYQALPHGRG